MIPDNPTRDLSDKASAKADIVERLREQFCGPDRLIYGYLGSSARLSADNIQALIDVIDQLRRDLTAARTDAAEARRVALEEAANAVMRYSSDGRGNGLFVLADIIRSLKDTK